VRCLAAIGIVSRVASLSVYDQHGLTGNWHARLEARETANAIAVDSCHLGPATSSRPGLSHHNVAVHLPSINSQIGRSQPCGIIVERSVSCRSETRSKLLSDYLDRTVNHPRATGQFGVRHNQERGIVPISSLQSSNWMPPFRPSSTGDLARGNTILEMSDDPRGGLMQRSRDTAATVTRHLH
jgi:hypothetical protein